MCRVKVVRSVHAVKLPVEGAGRTIHRRAVSRATYAIMCGGDAPVNWTRPKPSRRSDDSSSGIDAAVACFGIEQRA